MSFTTTTNSHGIQEEDPGHYYTVNYGAYRQGITPTEVAEYYNNWAESGSYEEVLAPGRYKGPVVASQTIERYCGAIKRTARILDFAAGTGLVGEQLAEKGFVNLDALDPAEAMLNKARNKTIYQNYFCEPMRDEPPTSLAHDKYDAAVSSGGMGEGHIPCGALREMIRIVKPGGVVCVVMREEYLSYVEEYKDKLEPLMGELEQAGLWRREEKSIIPSYAFQNKTGVVFVYRVLVQGRGA